MLIAEYFIQSIEFFGRDLKMHWPRGWTLMYELPWACERTVSQGGKVSTVSWLELILPSWKKSEKNSKNLEVLHLKQAVVTIFCASQVSYMLLPSVLLSSVSAGKATFQCYPNSSTVLLHLTISRPSAETSLRELHVLWTSIIYILCVYFLCPPVKRI